MVASAASTRASVVGPAGTVVAPGPAQRPGHRQYPEQRRRRWQAPAGPRRSAALGRPNQPRQLTHCVHLAYCRRWRGRWRPPPRQCAIPPVGDAASPSPPGQRRRRRLPGVTTGTAGASLAFPVWKQLSKSAACARGSARPWPWTAVVHRSPGPGHRLRRPERRGQVHHDAGDHRPGRGRRGQRADRRPAVPEPARTRCTMSARCSTPARCSRAGAPATTCCGWPTRRAWAPGGWTR